MNNITNHKHTFKRISLILLFTLFFSACGKDPVNVLRGSIENVHSLEFDDVEVRLIDNEGIAIVYTSDIPNSVEKENALNLLYDYDQQSDPPIQEGITLNLLNNSTLSRFRLIDNNGIPEEDRDPFPTVQSGNLTFDSFSLIEGSTIQGHFEITFITGDTMFGEFKANLIHTDTND
ncbi:MAG TPA: hypothetical protein PKC21_01520 [Oligoflexia bacterium]|nr:hypothetical protein [Oligoflexia bacterium]HMR24010.1 hypothetical protein [Oligoflexia bacterium]